MTPSQFNLMHRGEENSIFPRWVLSLMDHAHPYFPSQAYLNLKWSTRDDGKWGERSAQHQRIHLQLTKAEIENLIHSAAELPELYPNECLGDSQVHTHGGRSPTRSNNSSVICRSISFGVDNAYNNGFYIRTDSHIWSDSSWGIAIMAHVEPHLIEAPWRTTLRPRKLP